MLKALYLLTQLLLITIILTERMSKFEQPPSYSGEHYLRTLPHSSCSARSSWPQRKSTLRCIFYLLSRCAWR